MAIGSLNAVLSYLRRLRPLEGSEQDDGCLLRRLEQGDKNAFTVLMARYGPLVWGVCQRRLRCRQDAEDAFQASFLILWQKSSSLRSSGPLGPWLHRVASRTAAKALVQSARREQRQRRTARTEIIHSADLLEREESRQLLDEEIGRLPEHYRRAIVLCYLQGLTSEEAARQLGCPAGTVLSRLSRGRTLLRERLHHRGTELPATIPTAAVPAGLMDSLMKTGIVSAPSAVTTLAHGVLLDMFSQQLRRLALALFLVALGGTGFGLLGQTAPRPSQDVSPQRQSKADKQPDNPKQTVRPETKPAASTNQAMDLVRLLDQIYEIHGQDEEAKLVEAVFWFSQVTKIPVVLNLTPVEEKSDIENLKLKPVWLPPMRATGRRILTHILGQAPNVSLHFLVRANHVEVVTRHQFLREVGIGDHGDVPIRTTLICKEFSATPLEKALREIADASGFNVVLDSTLNKAEVSVTARLLNVPVDTAVNLLAELADLDVALVDNVFFVTTTQKCTRLHKRINQQQHGLPQTPLP